MITTAVNLNCRRVVENWPMLDNDEATMDSPKLIGQRIDEAIRHRGTQQSTVARAAGITPQALSRIISGDTKQPRPTTLFGIADALNYEARYLATGKGPRTKEEATASTISLEGLDTGDQARVRRIVDTFKKPPEGDAVTL